MSAGVMIDFIGDSIALGLIVNCGKKEGMKTILPNKCEWMTFGWCVAHRLEPALKDSLGKTTFSGGDKLILRMYFLYKKLPKKLQQLRELVNVYEEMYEFKAGGFGLKKSVRFALLFIVYIAIKCYLTVNFLDISWLCFFLIKIIILLSSHIEQKSLCVHIKICSYDRS